MLPVLWAEKHVWKTVRAEVGSASYQPASAGSSLPPASAGVYKRVDRKKTARFSALSGGFSHVLAGRRTEALKKHAEARWKTEKGILLPTPRLKPGAKRSRLKPADKAGTLRGRVEDAALSALRIDSLSSNRFLSPLSSKGVARRAGGYELSRPNPTAYSAPLRVEK